MRKLNFLVFLTLLVFVFPVMALSWADEPLVNSEGGVVEASNADAVDTELLKDERVLDLEDQYSAELQALLDKTRDEVDPSEQERLQKEVQQIKAEQEIALMELNLEIAVERGDEDRVIKIQEALDLLYEPNVAQPSIEESRPIVSFGNKETKAPSKDPDDI